MGEDEVAGARRRRADLGIDRFRDDARDRHDLDLRIVEAIVRRGDCAFLGLIGSATKRRRFEQQLAARRIDAAALARIACPIGIDGIEGKEPPVIAIVTVAQVLRVRTAAGAR